MSEQLIFMWSTFCGSRMGAKLNYFWKTKLQCPPEFFHKIFLTYKYFSSDPHFMILAWVQSWNIFGKLMILWSLPELFNKTMSHDPLHFTWSTFRNSSMGAKLKYFSKTHESAQSAWIFFTKHVLRTITFHVIHISLF